MHMKRFVVVLLSMAWFCSLLSAAEGKRIGILPGILVPDGFQVSEGEVFILEGAVVHVFDLDSLKILRRIGRSSTVPINLSCTPGRDG